MNKDYTEISFNFPYQNTFYFNIVVFQKIWYLSNINIILSTIRLKNIPLNHNIMNNVVLGTDLPISIFLTSGITDQNAVSFDITLIIQFYNLHSNAQI